MPDWLARLRTSPPQPEETSSAGPAAAAPPGVSGETPDWIKQLEQQASEEEAGSDASLPAEQPPSAGTEVPSWIEQLPTDEQAAAPNPLEAETSEEGELPLAGETTHGLGVTDLDKASEEQVPIASADEFAAELARSGSGEAPAETESGALADEDIPDWLRAPAAAATEQTPASTAEEVTIPAQAEEIPPWLAALKPEGVEESSASGAPAEAGEGMTPQIEAEPLEAKGPLAGLRGVLPLAVAVAEPHLATKTAKPQETASVARIFDAILAEPVTEPAPTAVTVKRRGAGFRPWIYLLVALAVIIPFFLPGGLAGSLLSISNTPAADFYDTLQGVPSGATVLMSFDYDPSMTGEMDLAASAIARDLMQRKVRIVALSTVETGPQIAQRVLDNAAASVKGTTYGADYLNLGYVAGHEAGLAQLAATGLPVNNRDFAQSRPLDQYGSFASVRKLQDVQAVVELAGSEDVLKMWMEQVQPRAGVRIVASVSAGVEPKARAYLGARQLAAMTGGLVGAARYEILSNRPGLAVTSINAQSAAMIVLVLLVVLGNIVFWVSRFRGRRPQ